LASSWSLAQATTATGEEVQPSGIALELQQDSGSLSTVWSDGSNPRHIQAYFCWDKDCKGAILEGVGYAGATCYGVTLTDEDRFPLM